MAQHHTQLIAVVAQCSTGNCLHPASVATTFSALALQQGHCITCSLATGTMKAFHWRPHGSVMGYFRDNAVLDYFSGGFDKPVCKCAVCSSFDRSFKSPKCRNTVYQGRKPKPENLR